MPSKVKLFSRRRSSGNALDIAPENPEPVQSSFRVLERPGKSTTPFEAAKRASQIRSFNSPLQQLRGDDGFGLNRWVDEGTHLDPTSALKRDRGSGGTTNSGSSGYYESSSASARHSSSSTLPSSLDQDREPEEDDLFPRKAATTPVLHTIPADVNEPLPPPPSFSARASRAFSFGQRQNKANSIQKDTPLAKTSYDHASENPEGSPQQRDRSTTTSSYASTAKPTVADPRPSLSLGDTGLDDDFGNMGNMFSKIGRSTENLQSTPAIGSFHRTESEPMFPPKSYSRQTMTPSPVHTRTAKDDAGSPYALDGRTSQDGMLSSSALSSPRLDDDGPPVPTHSNGIAPAFLGRSKAGYSQVPARGTSPGLERTSSDSYGSEDGNDREHGYSAVQSEMDDGDQWVKRVALYDSQDPSNPTSSTSGPSSVAGSSYLQPGKHHATAGSCRLGAISPGSSQDAELFGASSSNTTPKAAKRSVYDIQDESLYDSSPVGPASRATRPGAGHARTESGTPKRMTKAQFDMLQKHGDGKSEHGPEDAHVEDEDDDEDDEERLRQATQQRRKQEATMAVYRQQMKKVTGGGPSEMHTSARPLPDRASNSAPAASMSALHLGGIGGTPPPDAIRGKDLDDEDDDVPLGILQAHGFPGAGRPPMRTPDLDAQRKVSGAGSVVGGGAGQGNLPPFARRLPADPYFGASLVNPANRESLAFNNAQAIYGAPPAAPVQSPMGQPGGLVGVIANEERAKAARRGSPNPVTGTYNPLPLPSNRPPQMPQMPRTMSMGSMAAPSVYTPSGMMAGMPPMPPMPMMMTHQDQTQQQMQQFMQIQMQVMQNMLAMQQQQMGQSPQPLQPTPPTDYLGVPLASSRPTSMAGPAPSFLSNQGRSMTMMNPPRQWDLGVTQQRPMSVMPPGSYAPSVQGVNMSGGGPGQGYTPSIAPSERSNVGMPTRYRPVATNGEAPNGRSQSMTSTLTMQAFTNQQGPHGVPQVENQPQQSKSTIRIVDKPKGAPKVSARAVAADEDEDEGWAEMAKKRNDKRFTWRGKENKAEPALSDLYKEME